jgi:hypothetical protein
LQLLDRKGFKDHQSGVSSRGELRYVVDRRSFAHGLYAMGLQPFVSTSQEESVLLATWKSRALLTGRARTSLLWAALGFVGLQLLLAVFMELSRPMLFDAEYGYKLLRLKQRLAQEPGRPLILVLGSSRTGQGLRPETLPAGWQGAGPAPILYNFGLTGAADVTEMLCFHRLLHQGIRPHCVVIEVMPMLLHQDTPATAYEENWWLNVHRVQASDLSRLWRYSIQTWRLYRTWLEERLVVFSANRFGILSYYMPRWLPEDVRKDGWQTLDRSGWLPYGPLIYDPLEHRRAMARARESYLAALDRFEISPIPDRALRDILNVCRRRHTRAVLLLMPEEAQFRSWYAPADVELIDRYLAGLSKEYQAPLIDARCWATDTSFADGHHLLPEPAALFTRRFAAEFVRRYPNVIGH